MGAKNYVRLTADFLYKKSRMNLSRTAFLILSQSATLYGPDCSTKSQYIKGDCPKLCPASILCIDRENGSIYRTAHSTTQIGCS